MPASFLQSLFGQNPLPEVNYNFVVFVGADLFGSFKSVADMKISVPVFEFTEGGRNYAPRRLPFDGPMEPGEITLSWGVPSWTTLYEWMNDVDVGNPFRREVIIAQLGRHGWPTRIIILHNAWPTEWKGSDLDAADSNWALESLTLVYERLLMTTTPIAEIMAMAGSNANAADVTGGVLKGG